MTNEWEKNIKKQIKRNKEVIRNYAEGIVGDGDVKISLKLSSYESRGERRRGIAVYVNDRLISICYADTYGKYYSSVAYNWVLDSVRRTMDILESFVSAVA